VLNVVGALAECPTTIAKGDRRLEPVNLTIIAAALLGTIACLQTT
jgi:hypothetical protein